MSVVTALALAGTIWTVVPATAEATSLAPANCVKVGHIGTIEARLHAVGQYVYDPARLLVIRVAPRAFACAMGHNAKLSALNGFVGPPAPVSALPDYGQDAPSTGSSVYTVTTGQIGIALAAVLAIGLALGNAYGRSHPPRPKQRRLRPPPTSTPPSAPPDPPAGPPTRWIPSDPPSPLSGGGAATTSHRAGRAYGTGHDYDHP